MVNANDDGGNWLLTDIDGHSDYVRFTPESRHQITDVRFLVFMSVIGGTADIKSGAANVRS